VLVILIVIVVVAVAVVAVVAVSVLGAYCSPSSSPLIFGFPAMM
jgi:hypothetical protein